ncbi:MAG: HlyC/CorC family transporter [Nanoarchaeota archaeon]|nr:HlyC/CorC family transporter [Nanoarchaeota archaeon]
MYIIEITILVLTLFFSAFFSSSEIALISLSKLQIRHMVEKGKKNAELIKKLRADPHKLLINIAIANNIINIFGASFATALAIELFGSKGVGIATGVMTFLILTFGEIIPKSFAAKNNIKVAQLVSKPIYLCGIILYPFIKLFDALTYFIKKGSNEDKVTEDEIKTLITMSQEEGTIEELNKDMIHNILEFDDTDVWEVMTPRPDIVALEIETSQRAVIKLIKDSGFSRIPVYEKNIEHISGILYVKDLIPFINSKKKVELKNVLRQVIVIPRSKKIKDLLIEFQNKKVHMAIVIDENGGLEGIVTLEDVLEEITGEIYDEDDKEEKPIKKSGKGIWNIKGNAEIELVNKKLKLKLREPEDTNTISGLILDELGRIPKKDELININNTNIKISKIENHRIDEIQISKK